MRMRSLAWAAVCLLAWRLPVTAAADGPLIEAVKSGDPAAVVALLKQPSDVNRPDPEGTTALHWAVERDDLETAQLLIRAGADVRAANRYGVTPMYPAAVNGNAAMLTALLEAGGDAAAALPAGETTLMTAARTGRADAVQLLLDRGADVNARESWRGQTALMWAAEEDHAETVALLIRRGGDVQARSTGGLTPLLIASRAGNLASVKALVAGGANVHLPIEIDRGRSAGGRGMRTGNALLMNGLTPLHVAIANVQYDVAAFLIEQGADVRNAAPGWTPLHQLMWARRPNVSKALALPSPTARLDSMDLAKILLDRGADPNARQTRELCIGGYINAGYQRKVTPPGEPERAYFLPCNGDLTNARNNLNRTGATPFLLSAQLADAPMMRLLLAHGADPTMATTEGQTPLMVAAGVGIFGVGESPGTNDEALEAVEVMLETSGFDVNAVDEHGDTALHGAAVRGANEIVTLLVERGAKMDVKNSFGWTPLTIADGVLYTFTLKQAPETAALLRQLMARQGLDVPPPAESAPRPEGARATTAPQP